MPGTSDQIIDATRDQHIRERLTALRPAGVGEQAVWDRMTELVSVNVGTDSEPHSIALGLRYAYGQKGLRGGASPDYVTDAQIETALDKVFGAPTA